MCQKAGIVCIPSFQEGPHSTLNEDEFFDALEMAYQIGESEHVSYLGLFQMDEVVVQWLAFLLVYRVGVHGKYSLLRLCVYMKLELTHALMVSRTGTN